MGSPVIQFGTAPFVRLLLVYLLGIGIGYRFDPNAYVYLWLNAISIVCISSFFLIALIKRFENFRLYKYLSVLFYLFLVFLGWSSVWKLQPSILATHFSNQQPQALVGYIDDEPKITKTTVRFPLKITQIIKDGTSSESAGNLLINIRLDTLSAKIVSEFKYGDEFLIPSNYSLINPPYNPNEFDYQSYLAKHLIWHQANLFADDLIQTGSGRGSFLISHALLFRQLMIEKLRQSFTNSDALAIVSALVLGYRNELDQEIINTFSATGTIHVLSVSGLHVGIIFYVFSTLLFWMKKGSWKIVRTLILILLIWIYAFVTGLPPSVLRASIMISFGIIALTVARRNNIYNTISSSAFFLLLYNPNFIADIGFQLSYLAVLGIVYLYPKLNALVITKNKILSVLWSYAAISISAQLATFPLVLFYFHIFPVYFLPANILIILPATWVLYLGILVLLLPFGIVHSWFSWILENLIMLMNKILLVFEKLPYAILKGIWIAPWQYLVIYVLLFCCISFLFYKKRNTMYFFVGCLLLLVCSRVIKIMENQSLSEIRIYNVYRNLAIGFFDHSGVVLFTDSLTENNSRFQYSVMPNIDSFSHSSMKIVNQGDTFIENNLLIADNIIQFNNKSLLIYSEDQLLVDSIFIDLLYIRNNPKIKLQQVIKSIQFRKIILDASNNDWYIKEIEKEAAIIGIPVYILKNNFAYVW
ncbi:ComEC/Rec2 family competence protein [Albibacterium bauzanense]|uniref:Competence protein ComEC n=1 Tax=Albibacterium bauzanense TaxID=653929 RepID=A0A4R1M1U1_9SPHI|nr:ComEC/Rec2 family competence protein [Albibacterium bauzanense]TCK84814.1 competence protein ComEC [Albibacterium bauzanense]